MSHIEWQVLGACAGAVLAGLLLFGIGLLIDPARAERRALRKHH